MEAPVMEKIQVQYDFEGAVATITLNDGKGNVLDHVMMQSLQGLLDSFAKNPNLKLIVFQGEGRHFSFGASVEEHTKALAATMLLNFHKLFYTLRDLSIPTLAKVSGQCLGGGMELAIMCNMIFADKTAKFGQPEIVLGVFPPPASIILPMKIGAARAEELLITGRSMDAAEAHTAGLVNVVYDDATALAEGTRAWIEKHILPKSASSLRYGVKAARVKYNHIITNFLPQLESIYVRQLMETNDANEGIGAFLEKRPPVWKNS
jgi:cyclohexa-1,5-dienecarbonyl-CoA hydratase